MEANLEKVQKFERGIAEGSLHAPWKDEVWQRDARIESGGSYGQDGPPGSHSESSARAGFVV